MTRDQKQALKALLALIAFKAVLFITIRQASKAVEDAIKKYESREKVGA